MVYTMISAYNLKSTSVLQQGRKLAFASLQIRVSTDMLLLDEDVGDGALAADFHEGVLDGAAIA